MSDLTDAKPSETFAQLLHMSTGGITASAKSIYDGDGTESGLQISTVGATVPLAKTLTVAGTLTVSGTFGTAGITETATSATLYVDNTELGVNESSPEAGIHVVRNTAIDPRPALDAGAAVLCLENGSGDGSGLTIRSDPLASAKIHFSDEADTDVGAIEYDHTSDALIVTVAGNEQFRAINTRFLVGKTSSDFAATSGVELLTAGAVQITRDGNTPLAVNRLTDDGELVGLYQAGVKEGSISVSGTTVTYGNFCGHHVSQLAEHDPADLPIIPLGTVCETIDAACSWPDRGVRDRLPRFQVSRRQGSPRVYGVFMGWNEEGDAMLAAIGDYLVRVKGPCSGGDLLESAGDGTARPQLDDVFAARTLGKVTIGAPGRAAGEEGLVAVNVTCG